MFDLFFKFWFLVGFSIGIIIFSINVKVRKKPNNSVQRKHCYNNNYQDWFNQKSLTRSFLSMEKIRYNLEENYLSEAKYLYQKVKILCIILMSTEHNHSMYKATWAQSCNNVMFVNNSLRAINKLSDLKSRKESSWTVLCKTLMEISSDINFHWVLIVKENTFVLVENLRYMVASLQYQKPYYLGHGMSFWNTNYNSGEAGYVLSKGSLNKIKNYVNITQNCFKHATYMNQEDYYLGKILSAQGIQPSDTRDCLGFSTFHGYNLQKLFFPGSITLSNYFKNSLYPVKCCSSNTVTFKISNKDQMYSYHYLLFQLQIFYNGHLGNKSPAILKNEKEVWLSVLREQNINATDISPEDYYKLWEKIVSDPKVFFQRIKKTINNYDD